MNNEVRYCPHCGAQVGYHAYTNAAVCYRCDKVMGWDEATKTSAPGTDRRRARKALVCEIVGGILAIGTGLIALLLWMFV